MYCRYCLYNLSHTTQPRCPECGMAFDPKRPDATTLPTASRIMWLIFHAEQIALKGWSPGRGSQRMYCRTCFADLQQVEGGRCPVCDARFIPRDPMTFCRSDDLLTRLLVRFNHICLWRGVLIALIPLAIGLHAVSTQQTVLPGISRHGLTPLTGDAAIAMGIGWLGGALLLHVHYIWARVEPTWRYAQLLEVLAVIILFGGWGYAIVQAIGSFWKRAAAETGRRLRRGANARAGRRPSALQYYVRGRAESASSSSSRSSSSPFSVSATA